MGVIMTKEEYRRWQGYYPKHGEFIAQIQETLEEALQHSEWWTDKALLWAYRTTHSKEGFKISRWDRKRQGAIAKAMPAWDDFIRLCQIHQVLPSRWLGLLVAWKAEQEHAGLIAK